MIALIALVCGAYVKGCSDERERFDDFKDELAAASKRQEEWRKRRVDTQRDITAEADRSHAAALDTARKRSDALAKQLRERASTSLVPTSPNAPSDNPTGGEVCFDRAKLDGGIREAVDKFLGRSLPSVQRGSEKVAALIHCVAAWEKHLEAERLQPPP